MDQDLKAPDNPGTTHAFIAGDGEMATRMRRLDWSATPLGAPHTWPQSLKTVVRIMLTSRYAMWMGWGPELTFFCNDAYRPTLGVKGDWALGEPSARVWAEVWADVGPMIAEVMRTGTASWSEGMLLFLERSGAPEETYHTFSYSQLSDDDGTPAGMFCVVMEETQRVIGERRLETLRELASALSATNREDELFAAMTRTLGANQRDLPFTLTYLFEPDGSRARRVGATGFGEGHPAAPAFIDTASDDAPWPAGELLRTAAPVRRIGLQDQFGTLPRGAWDRPPCEALAVPIRAQGDATIAGFFVSAINPYRPFDDDYASFIELVASQAASGLGNARAYAQARARADALAEIDSAKTAFFSNVSHEFRTPLTLILGPLEELLAEASLPARELERLQLAHRNAARLLKLVNALLDFSRIEAGRMRASFVPTDIAQATEELASNFRSATERAGLSLAVDCPPLGEPVYVDHDMWEKIVLNLLSNAFKFTFEGEIRVAVRRVGDAAQVVVGDTGTGIPAAELPRMFERFHRVDGAQGRSFEGSGIGLALVQELVHLHGGQIRVDSEEGRGTVFTITLPLGMAHLPPEQVIERPQAERVGAGRASHAQEATSWLPSIASAADATAATAEEAASPADARPYILLADDNADMRAYVGRLLGERHDCEIVADGQAALEAMHRRRPDLLLTDIMMPRLDGFGLIRAVRQDAALRDVPIIALSARAGEEATIEGRSLGADDYLVKPFSARELLARVDGALAVAQIRRQVGEALRASEERFRVMADNAPVMIWTTDASGACTYLSRAWYEYTGQTPGEALGFGWLDATHPQDKARSERIFLDANARQVGFSLEYRLRRHDGSYGWALDAAAPWHGPDGEFVGYIGSVVDISGRKAVEDAQKQLNDVLAQRVAEAVAARESSEAQLRQAQKMESLGKLTGGVAHDFNNLLQVIGGNLQMLTKDVERDERAAQRVRNALSGVARGAKLASHLLAFGRRQPLAPKVVHLGRLIRNMDDMLRRALGEGIEIETVIGGGLWNTFIDAGQVENALLNLAINARDAMKGLGRLTIEAGNAALDDEYAERHNEVTPGQYVMVAVSDTGCGIPVELIERVFEPFFTTKREGEGTGLGLSMVYGFVKQSGGHVKIYSEPGHGTTIRLYLPRTRQQEDQVADVESGPVAGGSETVLVVEDDEDVRATVVELLSDLGYRVLKARDADAALVVVESGIPIDLLFTDVVMPGKLRSPELARKARERLPDIAVLFTSGYTDNAIVHGGRLDDGIELLSKPYTRDALARKIRHVLRSQRPGSEEATPAPAPAPALTPIPGTLKILLVEDDELIRLSTAELLELRGHEVRSAGHPHEAIAMLDSATFDILVTDVSLPGLSGHELAAQVRQRHPSLPVVFSSGHAPPPRAERLPHTVFLRKPYTEEQLSRALEEAVARRSA